MDGESSRNAQAGMSMEEFSQNGHGTEKNPEYEQQHSRVNLHIASVEVDLTIRQGKKTQRNKKPLVKVVIFVSILVVLAFAIAGAVTASILLQHGNEARSSDPPPTSAAPPSTGGVTGVCGTESCQSLARLLRNNMDEKTDPCEDFYHFSCGGWIKQATLPQGSSSNSPLDVIYNEIALKLRTILESNGDRSEEIEALSKVRKLYRLCNDTQAIDTAGAQPLLDLIEETGGWNLINGGTSGEWDINSTSFIQEKIYLSNAFFSIDVDVDDKNSSQYIIKISQGSLSLNGYVYFSPNPTEQFQAFTSYFVKVMSQLNSTVLNTTYEEAAQNILAFENRLVRISVHPDLLNDVSRTYNKITLKSLHSVWPDFDWVNSLCSLFSMHGVKIDENEEVIVEVPSYFQQLSDLFRNTTTDTLENYAKWQFISLYITSLSRPFLDAYYEFTGEGEPERYTTCITEAQKIFPFAIARPFIEEIYSQANDSKRMVTEIVTMIKNVFKNRLNEKDWLDKRTKVSVSKKVDNVMARVAYPDGLLNDTYLNELSSDLIIFNDSYFSTFVRSRSIIFKGRRIKKLNQSVDSSVWPVSPTIPNAYYDVTSNEMILPAGVLLPPVVGVDWPDYYNFGALGFIISHELTHGFDDQGQRYDVDGNFRQWWSQSSVMEFRKRHACLVEQYSNYSFNGHSVNGDLTLGENIADNGGVITSYHAYKTFVKRKRQQYLKDFEYSPDQIFFIAQAQIFCSIYSPSSVQEIVSTSEHSPSPFRVIGPMSNSIEFSNAFQCRKGSKMNPQNKCIVW